MIFLTGLLFSIAFFVIVQLYAYFTSGTSHLPLLHISYWDAPEHTPLFDTVNTQKCYGRRLEEYNKTQIQSDYANAWLMLHRSQNGAAMPQMEHFWAKKSYEKANFIASKMPKDSFFVERTDLEHNLNYHLYSRDGQVIAFKDSNVLIKERILDANRKKIIFNQTYRKNYDVVMVLNDGNWRIRHIVGSESTESEDTIQKESNTNNLMVKTNGTQFLLQRQTFVPRGINYYPAKMPWLEMWDKFDSPTIQKDMQLIQSLGANTVRIFIPFKTFGKGNIKLDYVEKLDTVLNYANESNLKVIVTLFDFIHDYSLENWSKSDRQMQFLFEKYKNNPTIFAWDIKNEADLDYKDHNKEFVDDWIDFILKRAKKYDPNHLITIGWSNPEIATNFAQKLDFVSFHYYGDPKELGNKIETLQHEIGEKPLLLEEFGMSSFHSIFFKNSRDEEDQYNYIAAIRKTLKDKNDVGYILWALHDFADMPNYVVGKGFFAKKVQQHFGLFDKKGNPKIASQLIGENANLSEKKSLKLGSYVNLTYLALFFLLTSLSLFYFFFLKKRLIPLLNKWNRN